ncbi:MAG: hypothetical protein SPF22_07655 [Candidatus Onthovivens sp.]|nr:hypothetical protein [Candidatus Onthovivens sp.]
MVKQKMSDLSVEELYTRLDKICKSFDGVIMETTSIEKIAEAIMYKAFEEEDMVIVYDFLYCAVRYEFRHMSFPQDALDQLFIAIVKQCMTLTKIPRRISNKDGKFLVSLVDDFISKNKLKGIKVSFEEDLFNVALNNEIISINLEEIDLGIKLNNTKINYTGNFVMLMGIAEEVVYNLINR